MLKLKQYLCKHNFTLVAKHKIISENLYQCTKCNVYMTSHWGLGMFIKRKDFPLNGFWEFED